MISVSNSGIFSYSRVNLNVEFRTSFLNTLWSNTQPIVKPGNGLVVSLKW